MARAVAGGVAHPGHEVKSVRRAASWAEMSVGERTGVQAGERQSSIRVFSGILGVLRSAARLNFRIK